MHTKDDKRELPASREENYQCNPENVNSRLGLTSGEGSVFRNEPDKIFNPDSSWRDPSGEQHSSGGQGNTKKMLCQLRDLHQTHLAFVDKHQHLLETQLAHNTEYRDKVAYEMSRLEEQIVRLLGEEQSEQNE